MVSVLHRLTPNPAALTMLGVSVAPQVSVALPLVRSVGVAPVTVTALVALPTDNPLAEGAESRRELGALIDVGAAAKPFYSPGTGITHMRAAECLAQAVWYEAASESEAGQRAVA